MSSIGSGNDIAKSCLNLHITTIPALLTFGKKGQLEPVETTFACLVKTKGGRVGMEKSVSKESSSCPLNRTYPAPHRLGLSRRSSRNPACFDGCSSGWIISDNYKEKCVLLSLCAATIKQRYRINLFYSEWAPVQHKMRT